MAFSINDFTASFTKGLAKTTNFEVLITRGGASIPSPNSTNAAAAADMIMRIDGVDKPGRMVTVAGRSIYAYGPEQHRASGTSFNDITLSVILSEDFSECEYFEKWIDDMVGPYRTLHGKQPTMFDIQYLTDYQGTVTITCYTETGDVGYQLNLIEAFPVEISPIKLSWSGDEVIAKLDVKFTYYYYTDNLANNAATTAGTPPTTTTTSSPSSVSSTGPTTGVDSIPNNGNALA
jgi:hypothetical protein